MWRKVKPSISLMGVYITAVIIENSMEAPQKLRTELPYDPTISFPGIYIYLEKNENINLKDNAA